MGSAEVKWKPGSREDTNIWDHCSHVRPAGHIAVVTGAFQGFRRPLRTCPPCRRRDRRPRRETTQTGLQALTDELGNRKHRVWRLTSARRELERRSLTRTLDAFGPGRLWLSTTRGSPYRAALCDRGMTQGSLAGSVSTPKFASEACIGLCQGGRVSNMLAAAGGQALSTRVDPGWFGFTAGTVSLTPPRKGGGIQSLGGPRWGQLASSGRKTGGVRVKPAWRRAVLPTEIELPGLFFQRGDGGDLKSGFLVDVFLGPRRPDPVALGRAPTPPAVLLRADIEDCTARSSLRRRADRA